MNIDERIEALTMNLELAFADIQELKGSATLESIKGLENIARSHETRITEIEEGNK